MNSKILKLQEDIAELDSLLAIAKRQRIIDILTIEKRKIETELTAEKEIEVSKFKENEANHVSKPKVSKTAYDVPIKQYSWEQSLKNIKIYLTGLNNVNSLDKENFVQNFKEDSVEFKINNLDGKNRVFISHLSDKINPEKSYYRAKSDMVVLFLNKAKEGASWDYLTANEKHDAKKNEKRFSDKETTDPTDPTAGLMNMMKKMYEDGDDDMKRTIAKAWTESREKKDTTPDMNF